MHESAAVANIRTGVRLETLKGGERGCQPFGCHITTWLSCAPAQCNAKRTTREEAGFRMWMKACPARQLQPHVLHTIHASARRFFKPEISVLEFRLGGFLPVSTGFLVTQSLLTWLKIGLEA